MYEQVFNFSSRPFTTTPFVKHYFPGTSIEQALGQAKLCIDRASGPVILIGDIGTGKSLFLAMLEEHFKTEFNVVNLACARLETRKDLLQNILFTLERPVVGLTESELRFDLMSQVKPNPKCPNGLLLLVDDAETLSTDLIDELRLITNYVVDGQPRVRLAMAGRFALEENLTDPKVASFGQRIACRCYLQALSKDETAEYVKAHISNAGGNADQLFNCQSLEKIYETTEGVPRLINQVGDFSLIIAGTRGTESVTEEVIAEAWADVQNIPGIVHEAAQDPTAPTNDWTVIEFGQLEDADEGTVYEFGTPPASPEPNAENTLELAESTENVKTSAPESKPDPTQDAFGTTYIVSDEPADPVATENVELSTPELPSAPVWASTNFNEPTESGKSSGVSDSNEERVFSPFDTAPNVQEPPALPLESLEDSPMTVGEEERGPAAEEQPSQQIDEEIGLNLAELERLQQLAQQNEQSNEDHVESEPDQHPQEQVEPSSLAIEELQKEAQQQADMASQFSDVFGKLPDLQQVSEELGSETEASTQEANLSQLNREPETPALPPLDLASIVPTPEKFQDPTDSQAAEMQEEEPGQAVHEDTWPVSEQTISTTESVVPANKESVTPIETELPPYFVSEDPSIEEAWETQSDSAEEPTGIQDESQPQELPDSSHEPCEVDGDMSSQKPVMGITTSLSETRELDANSFSAPVEAFQGEEQSTSPTEPQFDTSPQEADAEFDQPVLTQFEKSIESEFVSLQPIESNLDLPETEGEQNVVEQSGFESPEDLQPAESIGRWTPEHAFETNQQAPANEEEPDTSFVDEKQVAEESIVQDIQSAEVNFDAVQDYLSHHELAEAPEPEFSAEEPHETDATEATAEENVVEEVEASVHEERQPEPETTPDSTTNPFAETFAQEERLLDRFAPVIAAQNQISSQLTSSDLVCVKPLDTFADSADVHELESVATEQAESFEGASNVEDSTANESVLLEHNVVQDDFDTVETPQLDSPTNEAREEIQTEDYLRYAVVRPASMLTETRDASEPSQKEPAYHQQVTNVIDEDISRQANEILKRLQASQAIQSSSPVSHETEVNSNSEDSTTPSDVNHSEAILNEIRSQHEMIQSQTTVTHPINDFNVTQHRDDKEMIVVNPLPEATESIPKIAKIPLPETPASTGRAERMDYQQLFDQLRNVNQDPK